MLATSVTLIYILITLNALQTRLRIVFQTVYQTMENQCVIQVLNAVIQVHIAIQILDNVINLTSILTNV